MDYVLLRRRAWHKAALPLGVDDELGTRIGAAQQFLAVAIELGRVNDLDVVFLEDGKESVYVICVLERTACVNGTPAEDDFDARHRCWSGWMLGNGQAGMLGSNTRTGWICPPGAFVIPITQCSILTASGSHGLPKQLDTSGVYTLLATTTATTPTATVDKAQQWSRRQDHQR